MAFARASLNPQRLLRTFVSTPHQTLRRGHWRIVNPGTSNALPSGSDLRSPKVAEAMHALEEIEKFSQKHGIDVDVALKAKVDAELSFSSSDMDKSSLEYQLGITECHTRIGDGDYTGLARWSAIQGENKYMSSSDMYVHLNFLENLVFSAETARPWAETIFFRVSTMLSNRKPMILGPEQSLPLIDIPAPSELGFGSVTVTGAADYAILTSDYATHESLIFPPRSHEISWENHSSLFVTLVKGEDVSPVDKVTQAIAEMYTSVKCLRQNTLRGAVTNGREWIFLIFSLNGDGKGGSYLRTNVIKLEVSDSYPRHVIGPGPNIVTGFLAHWVDRCFAPLDENDWFCVPKQENKSSLPRA